MADKDAKFIVTCITREGIAKDLNNYLEACDQEPTVKPDDDRLTDAICDEYARALHEFDLDCLNEDRKSEAEQELAYNTLVDIGFDESLL